MLRETNFTTGERQQEILPMSLDTRPFLCSITRLDCNPEKSIPWHWHRLFEINYIRKGELHLETPEKTCVLHTGDANFINYGSLHTCRAVGDTPCKYYTLHFDMHFLSGIYNSILEEKYFLPVIHNTALPFWQIRPDSLSHLKMIENVIRIVEISREEPFGYEFDVRNLLSSFWKRLLEDTRDVQAAAPGINALETERLLIMTNYIKEHLGDRLTLEDIAASAGVSTRECTRCFSRCINTSPNVFLTQTRLSMAADLLSGTAKSIIEISEECGFSSPSYFGKVFRESMGCTPKEYRDKDTEGSQPWYYSRSFSEIIRK